MVASRLISGTLEHRGKFSSRQGIPVTRCIPHHWAGTGGGIERMQDPNSGVSVNYVILSDGQILTHVPEEYRAWTSGHFEADASSITFEVQNSTVGAVNGSDDDPLAWQISGAALNSVIRLVADIAQRYGWGAVAAGNVRGHREFVQTACPGGYFWRQFPVVRASAHKILTGGGSPAPATPPAAGKTVWQLADEVMAGLHGSGADRQNSLGGNYDAVQAEVNRRFGVGQAAATKSIAQLADEVIAGAHGSGADRQNSLGKNYDAVQAEVNRRLGAALPAPAAGPSIAQLADAVIRGDYGSGQDRVNALGANYDAVQGEVNRRLGGGASPVTAAVNIGALADAALRGDYGNGDERVQRLGANYAAVQAEINRRYS